MRMAARIPGRTPSVSRIVDDAGGKKAICDRFGICRQAVEQWSCVPANRVLPIEEMCLKYDRYDMRPDVFGKRPKSVA